MTKNFVHGILASFKKKKVAVSVMSDTGNALGKVR